MLPGGRKGSNSTPRTKQVTQCLLLYQRLSCRKTDQLAVNSWAYQMPHWIYVVLSRVRTLNSLVLNEKLDESRSYKANQTVLKWERDMKENVERKTFRDRGPKDYELYLKEEETYTLTSLSYTDTLDNDYIAEQHDCKSGKILPTVLKKANIQYIKYLDRNMKSILFHLMLLKILMDSHKRCRIVN